MTRRNEEFVPDSGEMVWINLNTNLGHVQRGRRQASKEKIGAAVYDYFQSDVSGLPTVWWTPLLEKLGAYVKATSYLMKDQTISQLQCSRSRTLQLIALPPPMIQNANAQCSIIAMLGIYLVSSVPLYVQHSKGMSNKPLQEEKVESSQKPKNIHASFGMAWTAYIRPLIGFLIFFAIGASFISNDHTVVGVTICLLAVAFITLQVLEIRSVQLYTDDNGVWVYRGILPWSKGISGIKWQDLEDAVYFTGFWSWMLKSYTVRVGHRFTKTSEMVLPHIERGNQAAEHINALHHEALSVSRP